MRFFSRKSIVCNYLCGVSNAQELSVFIILLFVYARLRCWRKRNAKYLKQTNDDCPNANTKTTHTRSCHRVPLSGCTRHFHPNKNHVSAFSAIVCCTFRTIPRVLRTAMHATKKREKKTNQHAEHERVCKVCSTIWIGVCLNFCALCGSGT